MLDKYFHKPKVLARLCASPIHNEIGRLVAHLDGLGYSYSVVQQYVQGVEHFASWATEEYKGAIPLKQSAVDKFLNEHVPKCRCSMPASRSVVSLRAALNHLLLISKPEKEAAPPDSSTERIIAEYVAHLKQNCGLAAETLHYRARYTREFLSGLNHSGLADIGSLLPQDVMKFVEEYAKRCRRSSAQVAACSLRSFLRFLQMRGLCGKGLVQAVPRIPQWKQEGVPKTLSGDQLTALLGVFDKTSALGRRDCAMALCMTELGLRVSEVVTIDIDDIDWRHGTIKIRSPKERRIRCLPLTRDLGKAIAHYLKSGRPSVRSRRVFVRHRAPVDLPVSPGLVRGAVRRAYRQANLPEGITGTHVLRHTTATRLYQHGASLKDIADLLGHRSLETTAIYTKVNLPLLATVALPWPEESS